EQEMVPAGASFWGDIALENYQSWQLGLLSIAFDEMNAGFAQLGSSKSRGLGVAKVEVESIVHEQTRKSGSSATPEQPSGAFHFATSDERDAYGLLPEAE